MDLQMPIDEDFAQSVLELEGKIAFSCDFESIQELIKLYSQAIEYFSAFHDAKSNHYRERLKQLLNRREVLRVIQNPNSRYFTSVDKKKLSIEKTQKMLSHVYSVDSMKALRKREVAINTFRQNSRKASANAKKNIHLQNKSLARKLEHRRIASMDKGNSKYSERFESRIDFLINP